VVAPDFLDRRADRLKLKVAQQAPDFALRTPKPQVMPQPRRHAHVYPCLAGIELPRVNIHTPAGS